MLLRAGRLGESENKSEFVNEKLKLAREHSLPSVVGKSLSFE